MQQRIYDCLRTRHHDGFVCEASVARFLPARGVPFEWTLLGDHALELLDTIRHGANQLDAEFCRSFMAEDNWPVRVTTSRALSC